MSINISDKPEMNVVNVGDELSVDMIDALNSAAYPNAVNSFVTISAGNSAYLEKDGGGTVVGTVVVDTDGTVGGNTTTVNGTSVEVSNYGIGTIKMDPVLGVTFPDGTSQGTAAVTTPDASTTVKGKVELATNAETVDGNDTERATTPASVAHGVARQFARRMFQTPLGILSVQSSGTGAGYTQVQQYTNISAGNAGVTGFTRGYCILTQPTYSGTIDWSKPVGFGCWTRFFGGASYAGQSMRVGVGYTSGPTAGVLVGDLTVRGFGFAWTHGGNVFLQVHDGTTLRNIDTGYSPPTSGTVPSYYLEAFNDGAGNVTGLVRLLPITTGGASVDYVVTSANGPTGAIALSPNTGFMFQAASTGLHSTPLNFGGMHPTFFYE